MSKIDLHIHSCYSNNLYGTRLLCPPSKSSINDIIEQAIVKNLDVIAITDHDNIVGSLRALEMAKLEKYKEKILIIPGVEVSSADGHILAYNVYDNIPKDLPAKETIQIIKNKGGVAVAAHPFNIKYSVKKEIIDTIKDELFALEISNSHSLKNDYAAAYVREHKMPFVAGSDAHTLEEIGLCSATTNKKITSIEEMLETIKNKEIETISTYDGKLIQRVVPGAINSFFYWKYQQLLSVLGYEVFLPYRDNVAS